jgi:hypothetical protein
LVIVCKAVEETRHAVIGPSNPIDNDKSVARQVGAAQAHAAASQSAALVTEVASAYLRNVTMLAQAAMTVTLAKMLENPPLSVTENAPTVAQINLILTSATTVYLGMSTAAGTVVRTFPSS